MSKKLQRLRMEHYDLITKMVHNNSKDYHEGFMDCKHYLDIEKEIEDMSWKEENNANMRKLRKERKLKQQKQKLPLSTIEWSEPILFDGIQLTFHDLSEGCEYPIIYGSGSGRDNEIIIRFMEHPKQEIPSLTNQSDLETDAIRGQTVNETEEDTDPTTNILIHELEHISVYKALISIGERKVANDGSFFVSEMSIIDCLSIAGNWGRIITFKKLFGPWDSYVAKMFEWYLQNR